MQDGLAFYIRALTRHLKDDSIDQLIPLGARVASAPRRFGSSEHAVDLLDIPDQRIMLLGNPGSGKTTITKQLCVRRMDEPELAVPVFVDLKRYHPELRSVEALFELQVRPLQELSSKPVIALAVFDGLNEASNGSVHDLLAEIEDFVDSPALDGAMVIVTCRTIDFPWTVSTSFSRYEVAPVDPKGIINYFAALFGEQQAEVMWRGLPPRLRELCKSPLLLGMLGYVLAGNEDEPELPGSRNAVYSMFLARMDARTRERVHLETPEDIREACLAYVAYSMQNERIEAPVRELRSVVTEYFEPSWQISLKAFQREVLDYPPMGSTSHGGRETGSYRSFMHQSFQEYYTAAHLADALRGKSRTGVQLQLSDLSPLVQPESIAWRETFGFLSGMVMDATELVRTCEGAQNLPLAALCVENAEAVDHDVVDLLLCRTLDQFKYGATFDYSLITHLMPILDQVGPSMPIRVLEDIRYWFEKYSNMTAQVLPASASVEDLERLAKTGSQAERLDALYTLGERKAASAVPLLEVMVGKETEALVREQAVVALGRIAHPHSLNLLQQVARSSSESKWLRAYSLHALGSYATPAAVKFLIDLLFDEALKAFAEDAAWAVAAIAKSHPALIAPVLDRLFAVLPGTSDAYTKGCVVFAIGCGGFTDRGEALVDYLMTVDDPFINEDGAHALSVLGTTAAEPYLARLCDENAVPDAVTRRHAVLALKALGLMDSSALRLARQDSACFVRHAASEEHILR